MLARLEKALERRDLIDDAARLEILDRFELEVDDHFRTVFRQRVLDAELQARGHAANDLIEVVAVDLDELAVLQRRQRLGRIAGEITHDADDERQLLDFDRALGLDIIGDVDPRFADLLQLVVHAIHRALLLFEVVNVRVGRSNTGALQK